MKYSNPISDPCEGGFFGEIEEYCVNIYHQLLKLSPEYKKETNLFFSSCSGI